MGTHDIEVPRRGSNDEVRYLPGKVSRTGRYVQLLVRYLRTFNMIDVLAYNLIKRVGKVSF